MIQIEAAGPELPEYINVVPNRLVSMADWVLNTCVRQGRPPTGGFVTSDLTMLERYITAPGIDLNQLYRELDFSILGLRSSELV